MTDSVINRIVANPPAPGHRISFARLDGQHRVELTDLYRDAGRVADSLRRLGLKPGDRIGILAANSLGWVLLDLAALRAKVVTAGFEPGKFDPDPALLDRYQLAMLFTDRLTDVDAGRDPRLRPLADVMALAREGDDREVEPVSYAPEEVTTLKFTSGSTGEPKGLAASVGSIDASLRGVQQMFTHGPGDDIFIFL
ncbi:MAG TPA: class I adenylate-forming enzyme family protein, partial [Micromonosporaceae bacterium]